jgi:hypothetical protein
MLAAMRYASSRLRSFAAKRRRVHPRNRRRRAPACAVVTVAYHNHSTRLGRGEPVDVFLTDSYRDSPDESQTGINVRVSRPSCKTDAKC